MTLQCLHNKVLTFCLKNMLQRPAPQRKTAKRERGHARLAAIRSNNRRLKTAKQAHACGQPRNALTANALQKVVF